MVFVLPYGPQHISHLTPGTEIRAFITNVWNPCLFNIRIISLSEFRLIDLIEDGLHDIVGYNCLPPDPIFGLSIHGKVFRAILIPTLYNCAYLLDLGCVMPIRATDPICRLPLLAQFIPGKAIFCELDNTKDPYLQNKFYPDVRQGAICKLRVTAKSNSILIVQFSD